MVRGHGLDIPGGQGAPQALLIRFSTQRRGAHVLSPLHSGQPVKAVVHQKVLGTGLGVNLLPSSPGLHDHVVALPAGQMNHHHRDIHHLRQAQQAADGLSLRGRGPGCRMAGHAHAPRRFGLGLEGGNHAAVLAVHPGDPPGLLQAAQDGKNRLIVHLGVVCHVELEGGNALLHHVVDLPAHRWIPVRDGHVETVVAGAFPVRLLMPVFKAVGQGLPGILGAEIHDGGGSAPDGRPCAGLKVVRRHRARHVQVKMGVGVDKTRKQQAAGHVHNLRVPVRQTPDLLPGSHRGDFLSLYEHVRGNAPAPGHHRAALQQFTIHLSTFLSKKSQFNPPAAAVLQKTASSSRPIIRPQAAPDVHSKQ